MLAAGLDGIAHQRDPGPRLDINMYTHGHTCEARKLPQNLLDALRAFEASPLLPDLKPAYPKLKRAEWDAHMGHLSEWERLATLDV